MDLSRFKSGSDIRGYALGVESNPLYMSDDMATTAACPPSVSRPPPSRR